jgi:hypothetical protein
MEKGHKICYMECKVHLTVARELARYKLDLVGVQEVDGTKGAV